jgi:hypothetical protein
VEGALDPEGSWEMVNSIAAVAGHVIPEEMAQSDMTAVEVLEAEVLGSAHCSTAQVYWEESLAKHLPCETFDHSAGIQFLAYQRLQFVARHTVQTASADAAESAEPADTVLVTVFVAHSVLVVHTAALTPCSRRHYGEADCGLLYRLAARLTVVVQGSSYFALSCRRRVLHSWSVGTAKDEQYMLVVGVGRLAVAGVEGVAIVVAAAGGYMFGPDIAVAAAAGSLGNDHTVPALDPDPDAADSSGSFADAVVGHRQPAFRSVWSLWSFQACLAWACQC